MEGHRVRRTGPLFVPVTRIKRAAPAFFFVVVVVFCF